MSKFNTHQHVGISPISITFDEYRFLARFNVITELLLKLLNNLCSEFIVSVCSGARVSMVECDLFQHLEAVDVIIKCRVESHHDINVTVRVDVCVVPIRSLQERNV